MTDTSANKSQRDIFRPLLTDFIDTDQELVFLADRIDWDYFEQAFAGHYSHTGQPAMPIRYMVGCLILKCIYDFVDETLTKAWVMNPYMQYFCGETFFQQTFPCDPSGFVHFRKRTDSDGIAKIFSNSVAIHKLDGRVNQALSDTTVQENNVTFPTDAKLAKKVIDHCNRIASAENLDQRQSYKRVSKQLLRDSHFGHHPRRRKKASRARKKLRTIAGRLLRELEHKLSGDQLNIYRQQIELYWKVSDRTPIKSTVCTSRFTPVLQKAKPIKNMNLGTRWGY